ncbi:MAG: MarR family transcriptional regulator [Deltaproteobacteria bacterium]|nr:MarR family transcriptional regulator [Deltaproteobacteria bacterium]
MVAIVKASELFKKESDAILRNYGLTFSQYNVLRILNNSKDGRNSVINASKIMLVSSPNLTGLAKRLEKNDFIIRKRDSMDERITVLEITLKGRQALKAIRTAQDNNIRGYLTGFSQKEKRKVLEDLKRIFNKSPLK